MVHAWHLLVSFLSSYAWHARWLMHPHSIRIFPPTPSLISVVFSISSISPYFVSLSLSLSLSLFLLSVLFSFHHSRPKQIITCYCHVLFSIMFDWHTSLQFQISLWVVTKVVFALIPSFNSLFPFLFSESNCLTLTYTWLTTWWPTDPALGSLLSHLDTDVA